MLSRSSKRIYIYIYIYIGCVKENKNSLQEFCRRINTLHKTNKHAHRHTYIYRYIYIYTLVATQQVDRTKSRGHIWVIYAHYYFCLFMNWINIIFIFWYMVKFHLFIMMNYLTLIRIIIPSLDLVQGRVMEEGYMKDLEGGIWSTKYFLFRCVAGNDNTVSVDFRHSYPHLFVYTW